jgi:hypothetical protein
MAQRLHDYVADQAAGLADELADALKHAAAPHYDSVDDKTLHARTRRLVDAFVVALDHGPTSFVAYVRQMTEERIGEGYYLREIQTALSLLEERMWRMVVAEAPINEFVSQLGCVTSVIGKAKDELASVYLERLTACQAASTAKPH